MPLTIQHQYNVRPIIFWIAPIKIWEIFFNKKMHLMIMKAYYEYLKSFIVY